MASCQEGKACTVAGMAKTTTSNMRSHFAIA
jgi:hypothetical protein